MRLPRPLKALTQAIGGLVFALALTEGAFWIRDGGAFPDVNCYVSDPVVGLRLRPNATERIAYARNPATSFRTNDLGFRGADWPSDPGGILLLGDSQVFGLGVEENETAAARIAQQLGSAVLNAGTPTWGPPEYLAAARDLIPKHKPKTVVVVLSIANDLFEAERPNLERHALLDGWAVRRETPPGSITQFPGRSWRMNDSHAMFALRQWLAPTDEASEDDSAPEATARDLVALAHRRIPRVGDPLTEAEIANDVEGTSLHRFRAEWDFVDHLEEIFDDVTPNAIQQAHAVLLHQQLGDIISARDLRARCPTAAPPQVPHARGPQAPVRCCVHGPR